MKITEERVEILTQSVSKAIKDIMATNDGSYILTIEISPDQNFIAYSLEKGGKIWER